MGLGRAVAFIFDDPAWLTKIAVVMLLTALSLIPIVGLIALAALLGYLIEIMLNVRRRNPVLLRHWSYTEKKIADGGMLLAAIFVYNLPNFLLTGCIMTAPGMFSGNVFISGSLSLLSLCCILPLMLVYTVISWAMLAAGTIRFAESGQSSEFYRFGTLFSDIRRNQNATIQWVALATLLNFILMLLAITICGNLAVLAFTIPVHAHLLGQYAQQVDFAPPTASSPPLPSAPVPAKRR
ncbi:MAG TPA: DUF4013 domain-containing protein [Phototrophicaceae bacterium]|jgi:hypothetical protein|nr:DUF4013 domain-containing protein [Phototrophicaceae bacterium]